MKNAKVLGIMLIIAIICFIIALIVLILNTKQNEKEQANQQLNAEHMIILMKHAVYNLNSSEDLSNNSITDEAMIRFALSYMAVSDLDNVLYDEYGTIATVSVETIEQAVEHIFNRKINYSNVSFETSGNSIVIPVYPVSTDTQIFKHNSTVHNEVEDTYVAYIDCVEPGSANYSELKENSTIKYDESNVAKTLVFKYKEQEGRKILLSYKLIEK